MVESLVDAGNEAKSIAWISSCTEDLIEDSGCIDEADSIVGDVEPVDATAAAEGSVPLLRASARALRASISFLVVAFFLRGEASKSLDGVVGAVNDATDGRDIGRESALCFEGVVSDGEGSKDDGSEAVREMSGRERADFKSVEDVWAWERELRIDGVRGMAGTKGSVRMD